MTKLLRAGVLALIGMTAVSPAAFAEGAPAQSHAGEMTVKDDAGLFHPDSVIKAEAKFRDVPFRSPTHMTVRIIPAMPDDKRTDFEAVKGDPSARRSFAAAWARELAQSEGDRGLFVLICVDAKLLEVLADKEFDKYRGFDDAKAGRVRDAFRVALTKAEEATEKTEQERAAIRGEGLVNATDYVIGQLRNTSAPVATGNTLSDGGEKTERGGMPWWGWVLIVVGVLFVIWIIIAMIRAMSGNVYGPGYGGYGGYGGGGGFFPSMLGGMFGAMAGMWMYNSFFGGHMSYDPGAAAAAEGGDYGDAGAGDTGAGDFDNGAEAGGDWGGDGGADWGDDGGGDWGGDGGGGDWGGGDFGGGDFGGGDW